jgi:mono/diheme cytochrome c family protein
MAILRNIFAFFGLAAIVCGVAAAVFFLGGFYSVAATAWEPPIVRWALIAVREASVARHAADAPPAGFDKEAGLRAGARAYVDRGCVNCHGAPGLEWARFSEGLRPDPPDLKEVAKDRTPAEIYWVVKNGINMTGMPSFGDAPDADLWSIAAFVKKLPAMSEDDFKKLAPPKP